MPGAPASRPNLLLLFHSRNCTEEARIKPGQPPPLLFRPTQLRALARLPWSRTSSPALAPCRAILTTLLHR